VISAICVLQPLFFHINCILILSNSISPYYGPEKTSTSLTFAIIHECTSWPANHQNAFLNDNADLDPKMKLYAPFSSHSVSHVEWMLRKCRPSSACRFSTYNSSLSTDSRPNFINCAWMECYRSSIMLWCRTLHHYYDISFISFTVVVVHPSVLMLLCKCNYSFFYSSKNQYHVYQHPKISMRAKNKIPRCNVDTHHSVYELQRSSVIIFMSWSHVLMSTILVKLANFVLIMSNLWKWMCIDFQCASVVCKLCAFHDRYF